SGLFSEEEKRLLTTTIRSLADIQYRGADGLDFNICYPLPEFCRRTVMWDLNYFKYNFLKLSGIQFNESLLEDDFERLADYLLAEKSSTFMYRDFQSRNVMIKDGQPWFIDFQGGRKGPAHYDVASFLWQAKANIPAGLRNELIDEYLDTASRYAEIDRDKFRERLQHVVLFRLMQVLGAYGFRGLFEKKAHFMESIPPALTKVRELIAANGFECYPTLTDILGRLADRFISDAAAPDHLTVTVRSFSYKRGIPDDTSGNGGGYVFDCRGLHNPGRYDEYKKLTGMDTPVIDFLEARGEVQPFLEHCFALADSSAEVYLRRGFTSLTINFGCTGGQHRSVYCAEKMAAHLSAKYGVDIKLQHREQRINKRFTTLGQQIVEED
ncbi:MAG: phosphotransferase, partial [Muribaculaceae bacterium]|nr:phosphotransferase [Muribaculaceae bacterium]